MVNIKVKNQALMAKWKWRSATPSEALWRKVIKEKYGQWCKTGDLERHS